jgi:hypothetical protein
MCHEISHGPPIELRMMAVASKTTYHGSAAVETAGSGAEEAWTVAADCMARLRRVERALAIPDGGIRIVLRAMRYPTGSD